VKNKPMPQPAEVLNAKCDAENQLSNFERVSRSVMVVPKSEVLKQEKKKLQRNAKARARKNRAKR
jgi:hypothetical protein